mmetsp:Transcript_10360/g.26379  ORF Transcript_10360/g.26379 Transcript_10360/m.26379 type:complete len:276 (-) Transcript_10360:178-1005(-)
MYTIFTDVGLTRQSQLFPIGQDHSTKRRPRSLGRVGRPDQLSAELSPRHHPWVELHDKILDARALFHKIVPELAVEPIDQDVVVDDFHVQSWTQLHARGSILLPFLVDRQTIQIVLLHVRGHATHFAGFQGTAPAVSELFFHCFHTLGRNKDLTDIFHHCILRNAGIMLVDQPLAGDLLSGPRALVHHLHVVIRQETQDQVGDGLRHRVGLDEHQGTVEERPRLHSRSASKQTLHVAPYLIDSTVRIHLAQVSLRPEHLHHRHGLLLERSEPLLN